MYSLPMPKGSVGVLLFEAIVSETPLVWEMRPGGVKTLGDSEGKVMAWPASEVVSYSSLQT